MSTAYIVSPLRTPVARAFRGSFRHKRPDDLGADVIKALMARHGQIDWSTVDDVIMGCAMPEAEQGMNVARLSLLLAGIPDAVPGMTINRFCSSGLQSIALAADRIRLGDAHCIIAGGLESMTLIPMMGHKVVANRQIMDSHPEYYLGMGMTAEKVAKQYQITREEQDQFAFFSHQKAIAAINQGHFKEEIVPIPYQLREYDGQNRVQIKHLELSQDEGPRADSTLEKLALLPSPFLAKGTVTAGNSSQMSDGAAACLVCSEEYVKKNNLTPMARLAGFAVAGVKPEIMGIGPIAAIPKACQIAGIKLDQLDRIELNEAFAAQALAVLKELKIDPLRVNPSGGAIALGHPLGATGAKLTATLLHAMSRNGQKWGMVSMCIGTGMGAAGIFELL